MTGSYWKLYNGRKPGANRPFVPEWRDYVGTDKNRRGLTAWDNVDMFSGRLEVYTFGNNYNDTRRFHELYDIRKSRKLVFRPFYSYIRTEVTFYAKHR